MQLDLFDIPSAQTTAPAVVHVRSYVRTAKGGTPASPMPSAPRDRAPHNGTRTSKAAAEFVAQSGLAASQEGRIYHAVLAAGARGMIREEIHLATGISVASVCGRTNTLLKKGMLLERGERESTQGRAQAVLVAVEVTK